MPQLMRKRMWWGILPKIRLSTPSDNWQISCFKKIRTCEELQKSARLSSSGKLLYSFLDHWCCVYRNPSQSSVMVKLGGNSDGMCSAMCYRQEALFECAQRSDFTVWLLPVLWLSRSAATKQFYLFGFKSSKHLWTSVYEFFITAICSGTSYMLIRHGMNQDTRQNFLRKYWKDAVYGSLAGFNASFMKQVLKNLIPHEALEDALQKGLQER